MTVPVLFDKKNGVIVSNESSEIIRMLNSEFNAFCATDEQRKLDLYPESLRSAIDDVNSWVYPYVSPYLSSASLCSTSVFVLHYTMAFHFSSPLVCLISVCYCYCY